MHVYCHTTQLQLVAMYRYNTCTQNTHIHSYTHTHARTHSHTHAHTKHTILTQEIQQICTATYTCTYVCTYSTHSKHMYLEIGFRLTHIYIPLSSKFYNLINVLHYKGIVGLIQEGDTAHERMSGCTHSEQSKCRLGSNFTVRILD